ncbi:hypothetical protein [Streptomyces luteireticuli]
MATTGSTAARTATCPSRVGAAGLTAHRRTVHTNAGDPRIPITIRLDL